MSAAHIAVVECLTSRYLVGNSLCSPIPTVLHRHTHHLILIGIIFVLSICIYLFIDIYIANCGFLPDFIRSATFCSPAFAASSLSCLRLLPATLLILFSFQQCQRTIRPKKVQGEADVHKQALALPHITWMLSAHSQVAANRLSSST